MNPSSAQRPLRVLLFAKSKPGLEEAGSMLNRHGCEVILYRGERKDPFPVQAYGIGADIVLSYMSPWLIPDRILHETKKWSINFHPGPPEYPGIGCTNFALYEGRAEYGVTAHLMEHSVDSGQIIGVRRFRIDPMETVYSLTQRAYTELLELFKDTMGYLFAKDDLPASQEVWTRRPLRRSELEALCRVDFDMPKEEIGRRIRATTYPGMPGAYMEWMGYRFEYNPNR
jgi:methionyl-tRNA formyltransferase